MEEFISKCIDICTTAGKKILFAILILIVGSIVIKLIKKGIEKADKFSKLDKTARGFLKNLISITLDVLLIITVISILGVPMTSVVAVLASCGLAIGLALQGALGNFAGGIMILIFKPFRVDDYISASGVEGTVRDISIFYTTLMTIDNKRITVPNGSLMNSSVTNFSSEEFRRVDINFKVTNDCNADFAKEVLLGASCATAGVMKDPEPFARITAVDDDTLIFTVRAWCESGKYWDVYFDLLENCSKALAENGIDDPEERIAVRVVKND